MLQDQSFALHDVNRAVAAGSQAGNLMQDSVSSTSLGVGGLSATSAVRGRLLEEPSWITKRGYPCAHSALPRISTTSAWLVAARCSSICWGRDSVCGVQPSRGLALMDAPGTRMPDPNSITQSA